MDLVQTAIQKNWEAHFLSVVVSVRKERRRLQQPLCVLIVGASGGIGQAIATSLATPHIQLALHYGHNDSAIARIATTCTEQGAFVRLLQASVDDREQIFAMRDQLAKSGWEPQVLVYAAGVSYRAMLQDVTETAWHRTFDINVRGALLCMQAFVPAMITRRYGRVIAVSSVWGACGASCEAVYAASKGALNALMKSYALELAPSGITVNVVAPGAVDAGMMHEYSFEEVEEVRTGIPLGRLGTAEEVASVVQYLVQPASRYVTGQVIAVSGGWQG